jgi:hypothetical protein
VWHDFISIISRYVENSVRSLCITNFLKVTDLAYIGVHFRQENNTSTDDSSLLCHSSNKFSILLHGIVIDTGTGIQILLNHYIVPLAEL